MDYIHYESAGKQTRERPGKVIKGLLLQILAEFIYMLFFYKSVFFSVEGSWHNQGFYVS